MAARLNPGVVSKRGKLRRVHKRPATKKSKEYNKVKYVRGHRDVPAAGVRMDRAKWKRNLAEILGASNSGITKILEKDGILPKWHGKRCPQCWKGTLASKMHCGSAKYQCNNYHCKRIVSPLRLHPFFTTGRGPGSTPLQMQAAVLFMILIGASHTQIRLALGVNHKLIEKMRSSLAHTRQLFVEQEEKKISFGGKKQWQDVEADECAFDEADMTKDVAYKEAVKAGKPILWEQWSGMMARGKPSTLIMSRLSPALTVRRAPGPGQSAKLTGPR